MSGKFDLTSKVFTPTGSYDATNGTKTIFDLEQDAATKLNTFLITYSQYKCKSDIEVSDLTRAGVDPSSILQYLQRLNQDP